MLHFHFIPNASFFIAFLGHTQTHTHRRIRKWQMAASSGTRGSQFAALGSTVWLRSAQRENEREREQVQESAQHHNVGNTGQNRTKTKRNETRRDETNTRYVKR